MNDMRNGTNERGSALIYILIAIALLAALTVAFMGNSNQQTQSQNSFKLVSELQTQIDFIRSTIQECVLTHPGGDPREPRAGLGAYVSGIPNDTGESEEGADHRYPINPSSTYLTALTPPAAGRLVKDLRCPGNPGNNPNHAPIFGGNTGKYMPPVPPLFDDWQWYNGTDGVFFWISSSKTDAFIQSAFDKLNDTYAPCEADKINATGGAVYLDSQSKVSCAAGKYCFRIWLKSNMATAVFPSESATCHS